jgi:hypothetical protein
VIFNINKYFRVESFQMYDITPYHFSCTVLDWSTAITPFL